MGKVATVLALWLAVSACGSDEPPAAVVPATLVPPLGTPPADADDLVAAVHAYEAAHPDVFAGVLLAGGRVWVGFTAEADEHLAALRARVTRPELLAAFTAEFSYQQLRALQARIAADFAALEKEGVDVSGTGVDVSRNRVEIGVRNRDADRITAVLARRYDATMFVVETGVEVRPVAGG